MNPNCADVPESISAELKRIGFTTPIIQVAYLKNNQRPFTENKFYPTALKYFTEKNIPEQEAKDNALKVVVFSLLPDFNISRNKENELTVEEVLGYEQSLKQNEAKRREAAESKVNDEIFVLRIPDPNNPGTNLLELDDILGEELYGVMRAAFGVSRNYSALRRLILTKAIELGALVTNGNATADQVRQKQYLDAIDRNFEVVQKWFEHIQKEIEQTDLLQILETEIANDALEEQTSPSFEKKVVSLEEKADSRIRALLSALPVIESYAVEENGRVILEKRIKMSKNFGLPISDPSDKSNFNVVGQLLSGKRNPKEVWSTLRKHAEVYPQLNSLLDFLPKENQNFYSVEEISILNSFINTFSLVEITPWIVNTSRIPILDGEGNKTGEKVHTSFFIRSTNSARVLTRIYDNEVFNLADRRQFMQVVDNVPYLNLERLFVQSNGKSRYPKISYLTMEYQKKTQTELEFFLRRAAGYEHLLQFLYDIGFTEAKQLMPGKPYYEEGIQFFKVQDNLNAALILFDKFADLYRSNKDASAQNGVKPFYVVNPLSFLAYQSSGTKRVNTGSKKETEVSKLAQFFSSFNPEIYTSAFLNAEQKLQYAKPEFFHLSQITEEINKAKNLSEVFTNPILQRFHPVRNFDMFGSLWLSQSFAIETKKVTKVYKGDVASDKVINEYKFFPTNYDDLIRELREEKLLKSGSFTLEDLDKALNNYASQFKRVSSFNVIDINGIEDIERNVRITTAGALTSEKAFQDIVTFFRRQTLENPRFGEKTRTLGIKITRPSTLLGKKTKYYIPLVEKEEDMVFSTTDSLEPELERILSDYIDSEFLRVRSALNSIKAEKRPASISKSSPFFGDTFGKNELRLFFGDFLSKLPFTDALGKNYHKEAEDAIKAIADQAESLTRAQIIEKLTKVKEDYKAVVLDNFNLYILQEVGALKATLNEDLGMTTIAQFFNSKSFIEDKVIGKDGKTKEIEFTEENTDYLLAFFLKNSIVHNQEFFKFFVGSLANFNKTTESSREVYKRVVNMSSPGNIPVVDVWKDVFKIDSRFSRMSQLYNVSGVYGPEGDVRSSAKRWGTTHSVIFREVDTFFGKNKWEEYKKVYFPEGTLTAEEEEAYKAYVDGPKEADAQGVVTLEFYRNYLISTGTWLPEMEQTFDLEVQIAEKLIELKTGVNKEGILKEIYDLKSRIKTPLPPLKLGHYGASIDSPGQTVYHKFSVLPLLPSTVSEMPEMIPFMESMYLNGVDYVTFESGSKQANPKPVQEFYIPNPSNKNELIINTNYAAGLTRLHVEHLRELQYQAPKFKEKSILTTQGMKLIFADLFEDSYAKASTEEFSNFLYEQQTKLNNALNSLIQAAVVEFDQKLGIVRQESTDNQIGDIISWNQEKLAIYVKAKFKDDPVLAKYLKLKDGEIVYPLEGYPSLDVLNLKILSEITKNIISTKINGNSLIQVSPTPFSFRRKPDIKISDLLENGAVGFDSGLKFYRKENGVVLLMEIMVAWDEGKHGSLLELEYQGKKIKDDSNGRPIDLLNKILSSNNPEDLAWVEQHKDRITYTGVRIPVQGLNSMESMRVKKFLPASQGSMIVLPPQIVTKSGGDYDIDKLTIYMPNLNRNGAVIKSSMSLSQYNQFLSQRSELIAELKLYQEQASLLLGSTTNKRERTDIEALQRKIARALGKKKVSTAYVEGTAVLSREQILTRVEEILTQLENAESFVASAENEVIEVMRDMLSREELYKELVRPNNSPNLTDLAEREPGSGSAMKMTDVFSPNTSYRIFKENILARNALGIDAKINTMQKQFQMAGLKFSKQMSYGYFFPHDESNGMNSLGKIEFQKNERGLKISTILNEFINGHVDVGKEDWLLQLDMNDIMTPIAHTMLIQTTPFELVFKFLRHKFVLRTFYNTTKSNIFGRESISIRDSLLNFYYEYESDENLPEELKSLESIVVNAVESAINENGVFSGKTQDIIVQISEELAEGKEIIEKHLGDIDLIGPFLDTNIGKLVALIQMLRITTQQKSIRKLTSIVDFNTANYDTPFTPIYNIATLRELRRDFNPTGFDYLSSRSSKSVVTKYNLMGMIRNVFTHLNPVTMHPVVLEGGIRNVDMFPKFGEGEESPTDQISSFSKNFVYLHQAMTHRDSRRGHHVMYFYDPAKGILSPKAEVNLATLFAKFRALYPDLFATNKFLQSIIPPTKVSMGIGNAAREILNVSNQRIIDSPATFKELSSSMTELINHQDPFVANLFSDLILGMYYNNISSYSPRNIPILDDVYKEINKASINNLKVALSSPEREKITESYIPLVGIISEIANNTGLSPFILLSNYAVNSNLSTEQVLRGIVSTKAAGRYARKAHRKGYFYLRPDNISNDSNAINSLGEAKVDYRFRPFSTETIVDMTKIPNPLIAAGVLPTDMYGNAAKDIQMAEESTQFIGFQSGNASISSTDKYRLAWGNRANTGSYSANDVIMVSGSGLFRGVTEAQIRETLTNKYKPLLEAAIQAGASFRVGNQYQKGNLSDELIAKYLQVKGYVEERLDGYSRWSPPNKPSTQAPAPPTVNLRIAEGIYSALGDKTETGNVTIDNVAGRKASVSGEIIAYRTRNDNFIEALKEDNAIGNPWNSRGYSIFKTESVRESVIEFTAWLIGERHLDTYQEYRSMIIDRIQGMKGQRIIYYEELNEPSHATALDYLINNYDWNPPFTSDDINGTQPDIPGCRTTSL